MLEPAFVRRVHAVAAQLEGCGIPYAIGGGLAYNFAGVPRATRDIDVNIFVSQESARKVVDCLAELGIAAGPEALGEIRRDDQVRLLWDSTYVDLFFAFAAFHDSAAQRTIAVEFEGQPLRILSAEDIAIFKVLFNRGRDWDDVERLVRVQGPALDRDYIRRWLGELVGADDGALRRFETVVAEEDARAARDDT